MNDSYWKRFFPLWLNTYNRKIRKPVCEHREEMAGKFANRIDYVDLSAFGVGVDKDKVEIMEADIHKFEEMLERYQGVGKLENKLRDLDESLTKVKRQLVNIGKKYDRRINLIFSKGNNESKKFVDPF